MVDTTEDVKAENVMPPEVLESVAFSLLNDALSSQQISKEDADFLKQRYFDLYTSFIVSKAAEVDSSKKCKNTTNDILSEKIILEKTHIEEAEEIQVLRKYEDSRNTLQKELEFTEQREIMAKFELSELKKTHEELKNLLAVQSKGNNDLVSPVLKKLKQQMTQLTDDLVAMEEIYEKESAEKEKLLIVSNDLKVVQTEKLEILQSRTERLNVAQHEPGRILRQTSAIENAVNIMANDLILVNKKISSKKEAIEAQAKRRFDAEVLKKSLQEKIELNRQTIEQREKDVGLVRLNLETCKLKNQDLVTRKVELNSSKKEGESAVRHRIEQLGNAKKEYDVLKRLLKRKRSIAKSVKEVIPIFQVQLQEQELSLELFYTDRDRKTKESSKCKDEVDTLIAGFLNQEGIEQDKKKILETAIAEVDELESDVVHLMAECKRQAKLLTVLSTQRDIIGRDSARVEEKEKEARQHVKMKELVILDLTKRCNEITNRLKEFSALYEVIKNERNKYVNLIQSSTQALAEMREKIRILNNEVEILGNESVAKDMALSNERTAHQQAQSQRDSMRQDMNRLLSEYRSKQGNVEQQIQEIDKLNVVIGSLEKDMLEIKSKYEKGVEERNVTGVQLIDRNDELCILYERSNQQNDALKKGELELLKLDEELRLVRLQTEDLKRQYVSARRRLPEMDVNHSRIKVLDEQLKLERKKTDDLSIRLQDPQNQERWRPLQGEDPDYEQLQAKIKVLDDRLDQKREQLLEKELILEEVSSLTERLRSQALGKRDNAKYLADELGGLQTRIRDTTKKMLASVSELSMYQATALRLQQEKMQREKELEEAAWNFDHGAAPSDEAVKDWERIERKRTLRLESSIKREEDMQLIQPLNVTKTAAEPRPTAYIPDELGIPKPYGNLAPFKPTEAGSTMRQHIRAPNPKPIEV